MATTPAQRPEELFAAGACPRCGADRAPFQEYCLECGARLTPPPDTRSLATAWRAGTPWYAGDWVWPALASLVVAVLVSVTVVTLATREEAEQASFTATLPQATAPTEGAPPETVPTLTAPTTPATTEEPRPPAPPQPPGRLLEWPAGTNGFTVVLASLPKNAGRETALARAKAASDAGIGDVGVIDADAFSSFHPGYFVVFSGVHRAFADAERASETARDKGYDDAYPKAVTR